MQNNNITIIAAVSTNHVLGKDNQLLWHLPNDFKHFKERTTGHFIIMGRKTFESFPKPLPNRTHVIITNQKDYSAPEGCLVVNSLDEAIEVCPKEQEIFVIGGGQIYALTMPFANKLDLTFVETTFEGDAFFPEIDANVWQLVRKDQCFKDEKHLYDYSFNVFLRKNNHL